MPEKKSFSRRFKTSGRSIRYSARRNTPAPEFRAERPERALLEVDPRLKKDLDLIGRPEPAEFVPDAFQLEAVGWVRTCDVIVSAPTGSGKTWIAQEAMAEYLGRGGRAWYASPLKALSNAKFLEFRGIFGEERVGLLTGDHKVNSEAPLIIGTTEILRNQLYESMSSGRNLAVDLVVLDEVHYLSDPERGVVWEEVLIYLPPRVRLLLLSATIDNAPELAAWLGRNRESETKVVWSETRPVPLTGLCLWPSNRLDLLAPAAGRAARRRSGRRPFAGSQISNNRVLAVLGELDLLPAIFFMKSRADCDNAARLGLLIQESGERIERRREIIAGYVEKYPFLAELEHLGRISRLGLAAHHAGHLPHYKLLVEDLMSQGLLSAIFATSTVSAGVNFPARTVVIRQSDRFDGQGFSDLTATEFTQMTGRAGRRGRDRIGFALMLPGPHLDLTLMAALMDARPDPVRSRLNLNFSMVLNLLNSHPPAGVRILLSRSLAAYQEAVRRARGERPGPEELAGAAGDLYVDFDRHLTFLREEGLVDSRGRLRPDGETAAELRLDHPLIFYAGLKAGAWPEDPALLAGVVGGLVADKEAAGPPPRRKPPQKLHQALNALILAVAPMLYRLEDAGFAVPDFNLRPAWALWSWALKGDFEEAVDILGLGAGDLAMLAFRTADHLRQMQGLTLGGDLPRQAREAIFRILKTPVSSPL